MRFNSAVNTTPSVGMKRALKLGMFPVMAVAVLPLLAIAVSSEASQPPPTLDELLDLPPGSTPGSAPGSEDAPRKPNDEGLSTPIPGEENKEGALPHDEIIFEEPTQDLGVLFERAVGLMDRAGHRLSAAGDASISTQRIQESAIKKLEQIIAAAQRSGASGGSSGSPSGGGGAGQSGGGQGQSAQHGSAGNVGSSARGIASASASAGPSSGGGQAPSGAAGAQQSADTLLRENRAEWGQLPPRVREELQQGYAEPYSGLYRGLTEQYYRRLATLEHGRNPGGE